MVKPVVLYGSETRAITEMDMKRLSTWERKILRIYGPVEEQGIWRIRTSQELRELYKELDTAAAINNRRLEWIGHAIRIDQETKVKKLFESKPQGSRRTERHRLRKREKVVDRNKWVSIIKEAKVLRGS
jgi:hypothetical protein